MVETTWVLMLNREGAATAFVVGFNTEAQAQAVADGLNRALSGSGSQFMVGQLPTVIDSGS